jgi:hypothetical protein
MTDLRVDSAVAAVVGVRRSMWLSGDLILAASQLHQPLIRSALH